jgi:hypothetical protein
VVDALVGGLLHRAAGTSLAVVARGRGHLEPGGAVDVTGESAPRHVPEMGVPLPVPRRGRLDEPLGASQLLVLSCFEEVDPPVVVADE